MRTILTLAALLVASSGWTATIIVPDDNPSLRDAVDSAGPGDVVQIRAGGYRDRIRVDKGQTGLTIEGIGGFVVLLPDHADDGVRIRGVDGVTVRGISIINAAHGVRVESAANVTLENLGLGELFRDGIRLNKVSGATVTNCSIVNVRGRGIRVDRSANVSVSGQLSPYGTVSGSIHSDGIRARHTQGVSISNTVVKSNRRDGIRVIECPNTTLDGNSVSSNSNSGIRVQTSSDLTITNNDASSNRQYGFRVQSSAPVASVADLTGAGNTASFNQGPANLRVD